jgi:hypothetical protein
MKSLNLNNRAITLMALEQAILAGVELPISLIRLYEDIDIDDSIMYTKLIKELEVFSK